MGVWGFDYMSLLLRPLPLLDTLPDPFDDSRPPPLPLPFWNVIFSGMRCCFRFSPREPPPLPLPPFSTVVFIDTVYSSLELRVDLLPARPLPPPEWAVPAASQPSLPLPAVPWLLLLPPVPPSCAPPSAEDDGFCSARRCFSSSAARIVSRPRLSRWDAFAASSDSSGGVVVVVVDAASLPVAGGGEGDPLLVPCLSTVSGDDDDDDDLLLLSFRSATADRAAAAFSPFEAVRNRDSAVSASEGAAAAAPPSLAGFSSFECSTTAGGGPPSALIGSISSSHFFGTMAAASSFSSDDPPSFLLVRAIVIAGRFNPPSASSAGTGAVFSWRSFSSRVFSSSLFFSLVVRDFGLPSLPVACVGVPAVEAAAAAAATGVEDDLDAVFGVAPHSFTLCSDTPSLTSSPGLSDGSLPLPPALPPPIPTTLPSSTSSPAVPLAPAITPPLLTPPKLLTVVPSLCSGSQATPPSTVATVVSMVSGASTETAAVELSCSAPSTTNDSSDSAGSSLISTVPPAPPTDLPRAGGASSSRAVLFRCRILRRNVPFSTTGEAAPPPAALRSLNASAILSSILLRASSSRFISATVCSAPSSVRTEPDRRRSINALSGDLLLLPAASCCFSTALRFATGLSELRGLPLRRLGVVAAVASSSFSFDAASTSFTVAAAPRVPVDLAAVTSWRRASTFRPNIGLPMIFLPLRLSRPARFRVTTRFFLLCAVAAGLELVVVVVVVAIVVAVAAARRAPIAGDFVRSFDAPPGPAVVVVVVVVVSSLAAGDSLPAESSRSSALPPRVVRDGVVMVVVVVVAAAAIDSIPANSSTAPSSAPPPCWSNCCFDLSRLNEPRVEEVLVLPLPPLLLPPTPAAATVLATAAAAAFRVEVGVVGAESFPLAAPVEEELMARALMLPLLPLLALPSEGVGESAVTERAFLSRVAIALLCAVVCSRPPRTPTPFNGARCRVGLGGDR
uniref:Uncharacterized protein n=1 Tax=Anopheles melas TaxID=34690 RepID=A0A182TYQ0_9DIPT